jgi:hypothetical protein
MPSPKNWYNGIEGLYSRLERAVSDLADKKGGTQSGLSWMNYLGKHSDVPKAEMDATGLVKYLTDNKGKTLQAGDLTQYLEANRLPLGEMRLGEKTPLPPMTEKEASRAAELGYDPRLHDFPQTQYGDWQLKGPKENYREFLYHMGDTGEDARGAYSAPHFDEFGENLAFHLRSSDRKAGNRSVRLVDEAQSDLAQAARDRGTYDPANPYEVFEARTGRVLGRHPDIVGAEEENMRRFAEWREYMNGPVTDADLRGDPMPPVTDFGHAAEYSTGRVPKTVWAEEQGGIPFYVRAAMNRQIYDAVKSGQEGLAWTTGAQQAARYQKEGILAGMEQFYDQKLPKAVAREVRRLGYDPEQLVGKAELPGEMPNAKLLMDAVSHRGASPLYNQDVYKSENDMGGWIGNMRDAISQTHGSDAAHEALMPLIRGWEQGMPHEEWRQQAADTYQTLLKTVAPRKQSVWELDLSDPTLREKILREGLPIMSLGTLGGKALYDQAQMNPLSALSPGASEDGI